MLTLKYYPLQTVAVLVGLACFSCDTPRKKPCTDGGEPPRENAQAFRGTKKCYQARDSSGYYVNDGKYYEWYTSDKKALEGEYKMGKKTGRWQEFDESGKRTLDKYFENGKEVPAP